MLADYKMYWDPKSNRLFFPKYETEPASISDHDDYAFNIERFKQSSYLESKGETYPTFEAVLMVVFGTWGLIGFSSSAFLEKYIRQGKSPYKTEKMTKNYQDFLELHPEFKEAEFATPDENGHGVPTQAIVKEDET